MVCASDTRENMTSMVGAGQAIPITGLTAGGALKYIYRRSATWRITADEFEDFNPIDYLSELESNNGYGIDGGAPYYLAALHMTFGLVMQELLTHRLGVNRGYPTAGLGLDLAAFKFDITPLTVRSSKSSQAIILL